MVNLHKNTKLIRTKLFFVSKSHPFTLQVLDKPPVAVIEDMDDATSNALCTRALPCRGNVRIRELYSILKVCILLIILPMPDCKVCYNLMR